MIQVKYRAFGGKMITKTDCPVIIYIDNLHRVSYVNAKTKKKMDASYTLKKYLPVVREMMEKVSQ